MESFFFHYYALRKSWFIFQYLQTLHYKFIYGEFHRRVYRSQKLRASKNRQRLNVRTHQESKNSVSDCRAWKQSPFTCAMRLWDATRSHIHFCLNSLSNTFLYAQVYSTQGGVTRWHSCQRFGHFWICCKEDVFSAEVCTATRVSAERKLGRVLLKAAGCEEQHLGSCRGYSCALKNCYVECSPTAS